MRTSHRNVLISLVLIGLASSGLALCPADTLKIGSPAPDFRLPGVDGKTYSLNGFRDADVLVIIFTCNHCPTAQAYEGRIKRLAADYKDKKVAVVVISPNDPQAVRLDELGYSDLGDSFEDMKLRAKERGFNFPLPLRRRDPEGFARLRPHCHAPCVRVRPSAKAPLHGPDRQLGEAPTGNLARYPQRHRSTFSGKAGAGGDDEGVWLFDKMVREADLG